MPVTRVSLYLILRHHVNGVLIERCVVNKWLPGLSLLRNSSLLQRQFWSPTYRPEIKFICSAVLKRTLVCNLAFIVVSRILSMVINRLLSLKVLMSVLHILLYRQKLKLFPLQPHLILWRQLFPLVQKTITLLKNLFYFLFFVWVVIRFINLIGRKCQFELGLKGAIVRRQLWITL